MHRFTCTVKTAVLEQQPTTLALEVQTENSAGYGNGNSYQEIIVKHFISLLCQTKPITHQILNACQCYLHKISYRYVLKSIHDWNYY